MDLIQSVHLCSWFPHPHTHIVSKRLIQSVKQRLYDIHSLYGNIKWACYLVRYFVKVSSLSCGTLEHATDLPHSCRMVKNCVVLSWRRYFGKTMRGPCLSYDLASWEYKKLFNNIKMHRWHILLRINGIRLYIYHFLKVVCVLRSTVFLNPQEKYMVCYSSRKASCSDKRYHMDQMKVTGMSKMDLCRL